MQSAIDTAIARGLLHTDRGTTMSVNCHATSTPVGDVSEYKAISSLIDHRPWIENVGLIDQMIVTANKGAIGHCFGAAGAIETVFAALGLQQVAIIH